MKNWPPLLSTPLKIVLGVSTISPFVFVAVLVSTFIYLIKSAPDTGPDQQIEHFMRYAGIINLTGFGFMLFFLALQIFFIIHAANNRHIEMRGTRTTWLVTIILFGAWVMP